jgi:hypothetical protein
MDPPTMSVARQSCRTRRITRTERRVPMSALWTTMASESSVVSAWSVRVFQPAVPSSRAEKASSSALAAFTISMVLPSSRLRRSTTTASFPSARMRNSGGLSSKEIEATSPR